MAWLFGRAKKPEVDFCDRCGSVCTAACRRDAVIREVRDRAAAAHGWRLA